MMSGGTGKNELSANDTAPMVHKAWGLWAAATTQSYRRRSKERGSAASAVMNSLVRRECDGSAALANASGFKCHHFTPCGGAHQILRHFFGKAEHQLAPAHFRPDFVRANARVNPQHNKIVKQVGAFLDHRLGLAMHRVNDDFDRLFS